MNLLSIRAPSIDTTPVMGHLWDGSSLTNTSAASPQYIYSRRYDVVRTPGFKRMKKRDIPINGFYAYTFVVTDSEGSVHNPDTGHYSEGHGQFVRDWPVRVYSGMGRVTMGTSHAALFSNGAPFGPDAWSQDVRDKCDQKVLSTMSNMKINLAQAFAERRQTANLLVNNVNRFVSFAILFRKGKFAAANRALGKRSRYFAGKKFPPDYLRRPAQRDFANLWLEYSYGWKPLLGDIYGAAELLAQTYTGTRPESRGASSENSHNILLDSGISEGLRGQGVATIRHGCKMKVWYDVEDAALDACKSTGISNPALLAWELLPYSFVVDWFIPVGNYLQNINASAGLRFVKGFRTTRSTFQGSASSTTDGSRWWLSGGFPARFDGAQLYRESLTSFPTAKLPSFQMGLNLSQVTSGISLLTELFTRKR